LIASKKNPVINSGVILRFTCYVLRVAGYELWVANL
jgi:hypothetical protein